MNKVISVFVLLTLIVSWSDEKVCDTEICKKMAADIRVSMDRKVHPCGNFYQHICGNYNKLHQIGPGEASVNSFSLISKKISDQLRTLLENQQITDKNLPQSKAAIFYQSCMDKSQRDRVSEITIRKSINMINETLSFDAALASFSEKGITSRMVDFEVNPDAKNPKYYIFMIGIPSLILSSTTLQKPETKNSMQQIESFKKYMKRVLNIMKMWSDDPAIIDDIVNLHIELAKIMPSIADQRNPDKTYNKMTIQLLYEICPEISWIYVINRILQGTGKTLTYKDDVIVISPLYISKMCKLVKEYKSDGKRKRVLYKDFIWAELNTMSTYGSQELVEAYQELRRNLFGIKGQKKQWQICVSYTSDSLTDVIGNMYVKKYFDASKKKDIESMVGNLRRVMREILENATWMDSSTKQEALRKLSHISQKIGYPESILDEKKLRQEREGLKFSLSNFVGNFYLFKRWFLVNSMKDVNEAIPSDKWYMGPQQVNAYYAPWSNEIVFPAAILQYPFYDIGLPTKSKYGGIGMVIGHEIIHAFDTLGSKFDYKGLLREWWTKESREKYIQKAECIQNQYGNYSMYGEHLQPKQTIGEDIADNAGIRIAYKASQIVTDDGATLPGLNFTSEQLLFVQETLLWCQTTTKQKILELIKTNVHTIGDYRVIGSFSNMPEFSNAFNCSGSHKLMNRPNKCLVW